MSKYFEDVDQKENLNELTENPCELLDFNKIILEPGETIRKSSGEYESLMVITGGKCDVSVGGREFKDLGGRGDVFSGKPYSVYIPPQTDFQVTAGSESGFEAAVTKAKSESSFDPYVIKPDEVTSGKWGASNFSRKFHKILVKGEQDREVDRLIVGETFTPPGNWSTYPPHRHENDNLPEESFMEEMYYFKVSPPEGWGLTKHYTDDREVDEVHTVKDETILKAPEGYHTVVSAPGYTTYYLWFLAGNTRIQATVADPEVGWVSKTVPIIENIEDNLSCG